MAAINCKTYDTGEIVAEIRENRRYALASPSTVTGTPSLAMQSAEQMAVVYIYINDVKLSTPLTISGTTKTPIMINGASPSREDLLTLSFEVTGIGNGEVLLTTDEPNGSPTSPFASTAELLAAMSSAPLRTVAWMVNPAVLWGASRLWKTGSTGTAADWNPPPYEPIMSAWGVGGVGPAAVPGVVGTLAPIWASPIIPEYMVPPGLVMHAKGVHGAINAAGVAGCISGFALSNVAPATGGEHNLCMGKTFTPSASFNGYSFANGRMTGGEISADLSGTSFWVPWNDGRLRSQICGTQGDRTTLRGYFCGKPSHVNDSFISDGFELISSGNL